MPTTLNPSGLIWNDPGDVTWYADQIANLERLNDTLLKPENLGDVDNTYFGGTPDQLIRKGSSDFEVQAAPWAGEDLTTTTSTTTTT